MASKGAEIRAGVVVLAGLVVLGLGLFLVSGGMDRFRDKRRYTVAFKDAGGIAPGDAVQLAGRRVGGVVGVSEGTKDGQTVVAVTIEVNAGEKIYQNGQFRISKTITGIVNMAIQYGTGALATESTILEGSKLATFEEAIDEGKQLLADSRAVVTTLHDAVTSAKRIVVDLEERGVTKKVDDILVTLQNAVNHAEKMLGDDQSGLKIALANVRDATASLKNTLASVDADYREKYRTKLDATLEKLDAASAKIDGILAENREGIRSIVQNVEDASRRVAPVLERIEGLARSADETVTKVRPKLVDTIENARRAMVNFESLTQDLKTAPWKLVNKPSDQETDAVHLYNAASLYTAAVSDVAAGIEDLETLRRLGAFADGEQQKSVEEAVRRLNDALAEHERRQKDLVALIVGSKPKN